MKEVKKLKREIKQLHKEVKEKEERMRSAMGALSLSIDSLNMAIRDLFQPYPDPCKGSRATSPSSQKEDQKAPQLKIVSGDKSRK